jgi:hypothetical protein
LRAAPDLNKDGNRMRRVQFWIVLLLLLGGCGATSQVSVIGDLRLALTTEPAPPLAGRPAGLTFELQRAGAPVDTAVIRVTRSMAGMEHPSDRDEVAARPAAQGRYFAELEFPMGGRWEIQAAVTFEDGRSEVVVFSVDVEQP